MDIIGGWYWWRWACLLIIALLYAMVISITICFLSSIHELGFWNNWGPKLTGIRSWFLRQDGIESGEFNSAPWGIEGIRTVDVVLSQRFEILLCVVAIDLGILANLHGPSSFPTGGKAVTSTRFRLLTLDSKWFCSEYYRSCPCDSAI